MTESIEKVWVISKNGKPIHLIDKNYPSETSDRFVLNIDTRMALEGIPVEIPLTAHFKFYLNSEELLEVVPDKNAARKKAEAFYDKVRKERSEHTESSDNLEAIVMAILHKVKKPIAEEIRRQLDELKSKLVEKPYNVTPVEAEKPPRTPRQTSNRLLTKQE